MLLISMQVAAMDSTTEIPSTQSETEEFDATQPFSPYVNPDFIPRPYRNGWQLTTSLVEPPQLHMLPIFLAKRAIEANDCEGLQKLIDTKIVDFTPKEGELSSVSFALLKCAIKVRNLRMCELLLKAGADANATSIEEDEGNNILSVACRRSIYLRNPKNIYEICKLLLAHGAKINKRCMVEAEEARNYILPLFVRHILTQPNGSTRPNLYVRSFEGRSPIYLKNIERLATLIEEGECLKAYGGLFPSIQEGKPFFLYGLIGLFQSETSHLYFPPVYTGPDHQREMLEAVKDSIIVPK